MPTPPCLPLLDDVQVERERLVASAGLSGLWAGRFAAQADYSDHSGSSSPTANTICSSEGSAVDALRRQNCTGPESNWVLTPNARLATQFR